MISIATLSDDCPICLGSLHFGEPLVAFACGHAIHSRCRRKLAQCPQCRVTIQGEFSLQPNLASFVLVPVAWDRATFGRLTDENLLEDLEEPLYENPNCVCAEVFAMARVKTQEMLQSSEEALALANERLQRLKLEAATLGMDRLLTARHEFAQREQAFRFKQVFTIEALATHNSASFETSHQNLVGGVRTELEENDRMKNCEEQVKLLETRLEDNPPSHNRFLKDSWIEDFPLDQERHGQAVLADSIETEQAIECAPDIKKQRRGPSVALASDFATCWGQHCLKEAGLQQAAVPVCPLCKRLLLSSLVFLRCGHIVHQMCIEYPEALVGVHRKCCDEDMDSANAISLFATFAPRTSSESLSSLIIAEEYAMASLFDWCKVRKTRRLATKVYAEIDELGSLMKELKMWSEHDLEVAVAIQQQHVALMDYVTAVLAICSAIHKADNDMKCLGTGFSATLERERLDRQTTKRKLSLERAEGKFRMLCCEQDTGALTRMQVILSILHRDVVDLQTRRELKEQELCDLKEKLWRRNYQCPSTTAIATVPRPRGQKLLATNVASASELIRHCMAFPNCNCIKARGPQSCKLSRFGGCSVHVGDCIFRRSGAGWGHVECAFRNPPHS